MEEKRCFKCGMTKPLDDFYKHPQMDDGHLNKCKKCNKKDVRQNYRKNITHYTAYEIKRNNAPERKAYNAMKDKEYIEKNPEAVVKAKRAWDTRNKNKKHAMGLANNMKRYVDIGTCFICGCHEDIEMHHPDYDHPKVVVSLCIRCHNAVHKMGRISDTIKKMPNDAVFVFNGGDAPIDETQSLPF